MLLAYSIFLPGLRGWPPAPQGCQAHQGHTSVAQLAAGLAVRPVAAGRGGAPGSKSGAWGSGPACAQAPQGFGCVPPYV